MIAPERLVMVEKNKPLRVLLIDDSRADRKIIRRYLEQDPQQNYLIFEAETGNEGLELAKAVRPDCMILDRKLPDHDGLELLPRFRDDLSLSLIPIVLMSGQSTERTAIEGFRRGAQEYLDKNDLTQSQLLGAIDNALRKSQLPTKLESALRESEERFRLLVESVKDTAIFFLDKEANVGFWNKSADRLFGYSSDEIAGKPFSVFHSDMELERETPKKVLEDALAQGHHGGIYQRRGKNDRIFWADIFVTPLRDETGSLRGFAEVTRDISDRIESERKLRKTETRLRRLVYSNITGIVFWHSSGKVLDANGAFLKIIGRTQAELDAGQVNFFEMTPPELNALNLRAMDQVAEGGTCIPYESALLRPDGTRIPVLIAGASLGDGSDEYVTFIIDISEQIYARSKMEEAVKVRDEFLSIASHELKTPITSLRLQIQMTLRTLRKERESLKIPDRLFQLLESSDSQIGRLTRLVEDLLDVARVNAGKMTFNFELFDLVEEMGQIVDRFRDQLDEAKVTVKFLAPQPIVGYWDRFRISQVFENLMSNAIKYGLAQPIEIKMYQIEDKACVLFRDQGIGIPLEEQPKIFDRFERVMTHENISGLGLGLYIAQNILQAHGGKIRVESNPGQGSTFVVELPLRLPGNIDV